MAKFLQCLLGIFISLPLCFVHSAASTSPVYIIYTGHNQIQYPNSHLQLLSKVFPSEGDAKRSLLYTYKHRFSGFSAQLNRVQANTLAKMEGVISVFRSKTLKLHTTRSWDFMGLTLDSLSKQVSLPLPLQEPCACGDDVVVGILDTGIWPESESFRDDSRMGPVPSSWKGKCVKGENFDPKRACNRKLIGARYYLEGFERQYGPLNTSGNIEYQSVCDSLGHGTHTASTAVGSIVNDASFFNLGKGTARGGAPMARLAVYKVCWGLNSDGKCTEADILAAFDDALHDGVHVISASFGVIPPLLPFFASAVDIGSFHAMQHGVSVVFSAGNAGPDASLVQNVAPWSICVAASTIDRSFPTQIVVGNNDITIMGESLITTKIKAKLAAATNYFVNGICTMENWVNSRSASGKVVLCFSTRGFITSDVAEAAVKMANGAGLIFVEPLTRQIADVDIIPTVRINMNQGTKLQHFLYQSPILPIVEISPSKTVIGKVPAPTVVYFSSRGPSSISPDILKPDISAPGVNILAAWPPYTPPTTSPGDVRSVKWNFQSGTSMSCPHVSGVVALIKSAHPDWSPAAIKSALMTTAYNQDTTLDDILAGGSMKASDPFDIGAGHINPLKAMDPGLIYDMKTSDYILYLCNIGYTQEQINSIVVPNPWIDTTCRKSYKSNANINYPSITISNLHSTTTIKRSVCNVGKSKTALYFVRIVSPDGVNVIVWPRVLIFSLFVQEVTYYVTMKPNKVSQGRYDFGEIVWSDGFHNVRSPLVVMVNTTSDYHSILPPPRTTL